MSARDERIALRREAGRGRPHLWSATVRPGTAVDHAVVHVEWGRRGGMMSTTETRVGPGDVRAPFTTATGQAREVAQRLARAKIDKGYSIVACSGGARCDTQPLTKPATTSRFQDSQRYWTQSRLVFAQVLPHGLRATFTLGPSAPPRLVVVDRGPIPLSLVKGLGDAAAMALARHVGGDATLHGILTSIRPPKTPLFIGPGTAAEAVRTEAAGALQFLVTDAFVPTYPAETFETRGPKLFDAVQRAVAEVPAAVGPVHASLTRGASLSTFYVSSVLNGHEGAVYRMPEAGSSPDPTARVARVAEHVEGGRATFRVRGVVARPATPDRIASVVLETPDREPFRARVRLPAKVQVTLLRDRATLPGRVAIVWFETWDPCRSDPPKDPVVAGIM